MKSAYWKHVSREVRLRIAMFVWVMILINAGDLILSQTEALAQLADTKIAFESLVANFHDIFV